MSDLISRSALLEKFKRELERGREIDPFFDGTLFHYTGIKAIIENQPTVEAKEVVHGEWNKRVKNNGGYVASITCSACGYSHSRVTYNFCPECGADMRGEKNGL